MHFEPKYRPYPQNFPGGFAPRFPHFAVSPTDSPLLRCWLWQHCFIFPCGTYLLQVYTAHGSYFDVSINHIIYRCFSWGGGGSSGKIPKGPDCLRYATEVDVDMLKTWEL